TRPAALALSAVSSSYQPSNGPACAPNGASVRPATAEARRSFFRVERVMEGTLAAIGKGSLKMLSLPTRESLCGQGGFRPVLCLRSGLCPMGHPWDSHGFPRTCNYHKLTVLLTIGGIIICEVTVQENSMSRFPKILSLSLLSVFLTASHAYALTLGEVARVAATAQESAFNTVELVAYAAEDRVPQWNRVKEALEGDIATL